MTVGKWLGEGNPTRADCVRLAAECINESVEALGPVADEWSRAAQAWAAVGRIADSVSVSTGKRGPEEGPEIAPCGHRMMSLNTGRGWVHPMGFEPCDLPPTD